MAPGGSSHPHRSLRMEGLGRRHASCCSTAIPGSGQRKPSALSHCRWRHMEFSSRQGYTNQGISFHKVNWDIFGREMWLCATRYIPTLRYVHRSGPLIPYILTLSRSFQNPASQVLEFLCLPFIFERFLWKTGKLLSICLFKESPIPSLPGEV